jgi:hypothetical protein
MRTVWLARLVVGWMLAFVPPVWADGPIAYITEIHRQKGEVLVYRVADGVWKLPQPLLALRVGDQIKVSGDARVVVLYHGGGTVTVSSQTSPTTMQRPTGADRNRRGEVTVALSEFFLGKQAPPVFKGAVTRGQAVTIVSPRHTRIFPGAPVFEWEGGDGRPCRIRVIAGGSPVWEQPNAVGGRVVYPADAPTLRAGVRYTWELESPGRPAERTGFEVLSDTDARRVRDALASVDRAIQAGYSAGTASVMRSALLFEEGLFAEASQELERAELRSPGDPTPAFLLAHVYEHVGLTAKARQALERAHSQAGR